MPANPQVVDVQSKGGSGAIVLAPFGTTPTAGGTIVVAYEMFNIFSAGSTAPTDNFGNTYTRIGTTKTSGFIDMELWVASNITTGASHTVTCHANSSGPCCAWCLSNCGAPNADWTFNLIPITSSTVASVGPSSPAPPANSLMLVFLSMRDGATDYGFPVGWNAVADGFTLAMQGHTQAKNFSPSNGTINFFSAYIITSTVQTATFTPATGGAEGVAMLVSIPPGASPGAGETATIF